MIIKNDFVIVSILLEEMKTNEEIKSFVKEFNINYEVVNAPEGIDVAKNLGGIKSIPTMFLINRSGNTFQKYVGLVPSEMMEIDIKKYQKNRGNLCLVFLKRKRGNRRSCYFRNRRKDLKF